MDNIPNEILEEIVSYLFPHYINSARLVNRRFSAIANIFKFRALNVAVSRKELDNLISISQQPDLAQCVREITYPFGRLALIIWPFFEGFDMEVKPPHIVDLEYFVELYCVWYAENCNAQMELLESGECIRALETAVSKMPNIRIVTPCYKNLGLHKDFEMWFRKLDINYKAFVERWGGDDIWMNILDPIMDGEEITLKATMDLINTSYRQGIKLDTFDFSIACSWLRLGVLDDESELWARATLFENLTCLSVYITTLDLYEYIDEIKKAAKGGQLHKFLTFAPKLRELKLAILSLQKGFEKLVIFSGPDLQSPAISLLDILGRDHVWKHLRSFALCFPAIALEDLLNFLGRHADTLKALHFQSCLLWNSTWRELLDFLNERLSITEFIVVAPCEVRLEDDEGTEIVIRVYNGNAQMRMQDYVLKGGKPFPPTEQELEESGGDV
ncbi:hypothetical protein RUND412_000417 [Rhizina undulata]